MDYSKFKGIEVGMRGNFFNSYDPDIDVTKGILMAIYFDHEYPFEHQSGRFFKHFVRR